MLYAGVGGGKRRMYEFRRGFGHVVSARRLGVWVAHDPEHVVEGEFTTSSNSPFLGDQPLVAGALFPATRLFAEHLYPSSILNI